MTTASLQLTPSATHDSFTIERHYPASAARVFAALADPVKKRRWFAESATAASKTFEMDFRVGGRETSSFPCPDVPGAPAGAVITNDTTFLDIVTDRRVVFAYTMSIAGKPFSASLATFDIIPTGEKSVTLRFTEQAAFFEGSDGAAMRKQGWEGLLTRLGEAVAG